MIKNICIIIICILVVFACENTKNKKSQDGKIFYSNGQLKSVCPLNKEGKLDGELRIYYPTGELEALISMKNGLRSGISKGFYKTGKLNKVLNFSGDKLHGESIYYFDSGKKSSICEYYYDQLITEKFFYKNGLCESQSARNLNKHNINSSVYFDENGKILKRKSHFLKLKFLNDEHSKMSIELFNFYQDSIVVLFRESLAEIDNPNDFVYSVSDSIRTIRFENCKNSPIIIDVRNTDYYNNRLNIEVLTFGKANKPSRINGKSIFFYPPMKKIAIQLNRDEKPKDYNIDGIIL